MLHQRKIVLERCVKAPASSRSGCLCRRCAAWRGRSCNVIISPCSRVTRGLRLIYPQPPMLRSEVLIEAPRDQRTNQMISTRSRQSGSGEEFSIGRHFYRHQVLSIRGASYWRKHAMRLFVIALASATILGTAAHAQNTRVLEPEARPGQPTAGPPQATDRRTTTGQAPVPVPGAGSPHGAQGGATSNPNPDRVPAGTPGGQSKPPGN